MSKRQTQKQAAKPEAPYDPTLVGYARVSTEEQSLDLQIDALIRAGVHPDRIKSEKVSGVAAKRPGRDLALKLTRKGDTFVVWRLDRVGRSLIDLLDFIDTLEKRGVAFRSLKDSIDTASPAGKMMLAILGAAAQFERDIIVERTKAGIRVAQSNGVRFGQPKRYEGREDEMRDLLRSGLSLEDAAREFGCAPATIRNYLGTAAIQRLRAEAKS